jgi:cell wall-associated NlpC family hydrolase
MGKGLSGLRLGFRILPGLLIIPLLAAFFGCVSTAVKNREPSPDAVFRENIVDYATTLLGKPYRNGAKGPNAFDCSGYVYYVYGRFGVAVPVSTEGLSKVGREVPREDVTRGDLAIFRIKGDHHVGIMINGLEFIHASKSKGVTIDSIDAPYWKKNFSHFRRIL